MRRAIVGVNETRPGSTCCICGLYGAWDTQSRERNFKQGPESKYKEEDLSRCSFLVKLAAFPIFVEFFFWPAFTARQRRQRKVVYATRSVCVHDYIVLVLTCVDTQTNSNLGRLRVLSC